MMTNKDLEDIRKLLDKAVSASTKREAKTYLAALRFKASSLRAQLDGYAIGKLKEAINYAVSASGQVRDKAHWVSCMVSSWYVFENDVIRESNSSGNHNV